MRGYTKKGKLFLGFDTNMTEAISSMSITGNELCVAGTHVYNHYTDCKDANCFLSEDVITDVLALPGEKVRDRHKWYKKSSEYWLRLCDPVPRIRGQRTRASLRVFGSTYL